MLFLLFPFLALASAAPRIEVFTERAAVVAEYCRVETGAHFDDCTAPRNTGLAVVYLPLELGAKVSTSINESIRLGYTGEISREDLFHGHMMLSGPQLEYASAESFLSDLKVVLFHSAEYTQRWRKEGMRNIPIDQRTPRSFLGWVESGLQKAVDFVGPSQRLKSYEQAGTIYSEEIVESHPGQFLHKYSNFGGIEPLHLNANGIRCEAKQSLYVFQEPGGRFVSPDGKPYELFFHCVFPL